MHQDSFFFIYAAENDNCEILFVETTDPITWTDNIKKAKKFTTFESAKMDIEKEYDVFLKTSKNTKYNTLWIVESNHDHSVLRRREQIL